MKKNVFSRTIAVLASMTVLGAATMLSASAKGLQVGTVTVEQGATSVVVPITLVDVDAKGYSATFSSTADVFTSVKAENKLITDGDLQSGFYVVSVSAEGYDDNIANNLTIGLDPDAEPGEYPITVEIESLDENGANIADPEAFDGKVIIEAAATEPEPTEPSTDAPTTAAPTTAAATTTPKKDSSPKTGSTGVAVAVAGLVTAGATAVVLKKKH